MTVHFSKTAAGASVQIDTQAPQEYINPVVTLEPAGTLFAITINRIVQLFKLTDLVYINSVQVCGAGAAPQKTAAEICNLLSGVFAVETPAKKMVAAVLQSAAMAKGSNPHYNGVSASPPTVTQASDPASGLTNYYYATSSGSLNNAAPFNFAGGKPKIAFGFLLRFPCVKDGTLPGNCDDGDTATNWRVGFVTDAPKVAIGVGANAVKIIVDGAYISATPISITGGGVQYVTVDFGSAKNRDIILESTSANAFVGVAVSPAYKVWKPAKSLRIIVVGDSFTEGTGATWPNDAYARVMGDYLGIADVWSSGSGGTGYTAKSGGSKNTFAERISDWTSNSPDVVVFAGGINDADDNALQPAVLSVLQATRVALPNTVICVLGAWPAATGPNAAIISKEGKIAAAVTAFADRYTAFIPVATDAQGSWVSGTGKISSTTGSGNSDIVTSSDGTHPGDYGHNYLGVMVADAIVKALNAM